jgi:hypothetical protein
LYGAAVNVKMAQLVARPKRFRVVLANLTVFLHVWPQVAVRMEMVKRIRYACVRKPIDGWLRCRRASASVKKKKKLALIDLD